MKKILALLVVIFSLTNNIYSQSSLNKALKVVNKISEFAGPALALKEMYNYVYSSEHEKEVKDGLKIILEDNDPNRALDRLLAVGVDDRDYAKVQAAFGKAVCYFELGQYEKAYNNLKYVRNFNISWNTINQDMIRKAKRDAKDFYKVINMVVDNENGDYYLDNGEHTKAFYNYYESAKAGYKIGQYNLGMCYLYGTGVATNYKYAVTMFKKAKAQNYSPATQQLAYCFYYGKGVIRDYSTAFTYFEKLAKYNWKEAQYYVGDCYESGRGVEANEQQAFFWLNKSANNGYANAQLSVGLAYELGRLGLRKNMAEAVKWYKKAAEQDNAYALYALGVCYHEGNGVNKDYQKAASLFRKSAELGCPSAQNWMGYYFENGYGVEKDVKQAAKWYQKAIENGYIGSAREVLSQLNSQGIGEHVSNLKDPALVYYNKLMSELKKMKLGLSGSPTLDQYNTYVNQMDDMRYAREILEGRVAEVQINQFGSLFREVNGLLKKVDVPSLYFNDIMSELKSKKTELKNTHTKIDRYTFFRNYHIKEYMAKNMEIKFSASQEKQIKTLYHEVYSLVK